MSPAQTLAEVMLLERELQTPAARSDPSRLRALLAPDFEEIGASGRIWDLDSTLGLLAAEQSNTAEIEVHDLTGRVLADRLVLLRWESRRGERVARRTSLWRHDPEGWRQVHHQGTPVAD